MAVYKRGKQYWYKFKWSVKSDDGLRETFVVRRTARATNKRDAEDAENEHRRALRLGEIHPLDPWLKPPAPQAPTLREFSKRFEDYSGVHTKESTANFYKECTRRVLLFSPMADATLDLITGETITRYTKWRQAQKKGNSVAAINAETRTLRRMFNLAEEWGIISKAPAIHELPGQKGRERVVSFEEEAAYLRCASGTLRDMAILAVDTGLRPQSELFRLEWANVHLQADRESPYGFIHVAQGKTASAVRNVPLTMRSRMIVEARRAATRQSKYVFPGDGRSGHILSVQHPHEQTIKKTTLASGAKLEPFEFYCWRHTFGTRCAESGMDKFTLARLMGHSSPRIAERYYIHVTEPHVTAGVGRFHAYLAARQIESVPAASDTIQ